MRFITTVTFSLALAAGLGVADAEAKYSLCNKTSYALSAAIGYVDSERLATRGWWRLRPGQCKVVLTEETVPGRYFVYAEAIPGHKGALRTWSGDTALCVENSGFFNLRNQDVCREDPRQRREFMSVEVTAAAEGAFQTDFTEASNFTVYSAKVAGVQRLLRDLGKPIKQIDGSLGSETRIQLAAYRKQKSLPESTTFDDELIDLLIEDANAAEAKLGFFFCNKADAAVWSAIADNGGGDVYVSKGWWKLEPGDCAKVLKGELQSDHYYVYGVIDRAEGGELELKGGDKPFCVNAVLFDEKNDADCAEKELKPALFRRFDVGGETTATFNFQPDMFVEKAASAPASSGEAR